MILNFVNSLLGVNCNKSTNLKRVRVLQSKHKIDNSPAPDKQKTVAVKVANKNIIATFDIIQTK